MRSFLLFTGLGIIAPSSIILYAATTQHTVTELAWGAGAFIVAGIVLFMLGLALGGRRERQ
jgi:hypothetical protein